MFLSLSFSSVRVLPRLPCLLLFPPQQFSDVGHSMMTMFTYALGGVDLDVRHPRTHVARLITCVDQDVHVQYDFVCTFQLWTAS